MNHHRVIAPLPALIALLLVAGCSDVQKRSYEVSLKNDSATPVTVWLTKEGPVYEKGWKSPEDLAIESRSAGEQIAGVIVPPGKTASVGPLFGKFKPQSTAILRVYLGRHDFSDLLAMSKGSPDRHDYDLIPGYNGFTVVDREGSLYVRREKPVALNSEGSKSK